MGSAFRNRNRNTRIQPAGQNGQDSNKWLKQNITGEEFSNWFRHDPNPRYTAMKVVEQQLKDLEPKK